MGEGCPILEGRVFSGVREASAQALGSLGPYLCQLLPQVTYFLLCRFKYGDSCEASAQVLDRLGPHLGQLLPQVTKSLLIILKYGDVFEAPAQVLDRLGPH